MTGLFKMRPVAAVSLLALSANGSMYTSGPGDDGLCAPDVGQYSTLSASGTNSAKECSDACDQMNNEQVGTQTELLDSMLLRLLTNPRDSTNTTASSHTDGELCSIFED